MKIEDIKIGDKLLMTSNGRKENVTVVKITKQNIFFENPWIRYNIKEGVQRKEGSSWDNYCSASLYQNEEEYQKRLETRQKRLFIERHISLLSAEEVDVLYEKILKLQAK